MIHDPLASMDRLDEAFSSLEREFNQFREKSTKVQTELQFNLASRNEYIRTLNSHIRELQTELERLVSQGSSVDEINDALAKASRTIENLETQNRELESRLDTLRNTQKSDQTEVKEILDQLDKLFRELENA